MKNGKYLSECELTSYLLDKYIVVTRGGGEDYKVGFNDLIENIKYTMLREYLRSKLGSLHININNQQRDKVKYNDGYLEYLMLNGQEIHKKDYEELFKVLGIEGETYKLPNYWQEEGGCTLKHVKEGSGRALNSYEKDNIKEHVHPLNLNLETETFDIDLNHNHFFSIQAATGAIMYARLNDGYYCWTSGDFSRRGLGCVNVGDSKFKIDLEFNELSLKTERYTHDSSKKRSDPINVKVKPYKGFTNQSGQKENTVKNMGVQCYMISKVLI